jgi:hypothetical protein
MQVVVVALRIFLLGQEGKAVLAVVAGELEMDKKQLLALQILAAVEVVQKLNRQHQHI